MSEIKAHIFISYSRKDKDFVYKVTKDIESQGLNVWIDEHNIKPGANIVEAIETGLKTARFMLLFLSKNSIESKWVKEEWTSKYHDQINNSQIVIIPLIIDSLRKDKLPQFLLSKKIINLSNNYDQNLKYLLDHVWTPIKYK